MDAQTAFRIARPKARKLARQGRLIDETFKIFQRTVFPGAPQDEVAALRIAFFAGAQELFALVSAGLDEGEEPSSADMEFMSNWVEELEHFHRRTIDAASAQSSNKPN